MSLCVPLTLPLLLPLPLPLPTGRILYHTILFRFYYMSLRRGRQAAIASPFVVICIYVMGVRGEARACKVRSLVLYEFFRVFYALDMKICSSRVSPQQQQ